MEASQACSSPMFSETNEGQREMKEIKQQLRAHVIPYFLPRHLQKCCKLLKQVVVHKNKDISNNFYS